MEFMGFSCANFVRATVLAAFVAVGVNTAVNTSAGTQKFSNLGSSAVITLNIPIWN